MEPSPLHKRMIKKIFRTGLFALGSLFLMSLFAVILYRYIPVRYTPLMAIRKVEYKRK